MNSLLTNKINEIKKEYQNNKYVFIPQNIVLDLIKQLGAQENDINVLINYGDYLA